MPFMKLERKNIHTQPFTPQSIYDTKNFHKKRIDFYMKNFHLWIYPRAEDHIIL